MSSVKLPKLNLIPYGIYSGSRNMAMDEYMLSLEGAFLRFYGWDGIVLSYGKSKKEKINPNDQFCAANNITKIRRPSGGKTVLHQYELTYAFSADQDLFPTSIIETYRLISQPIISCFQNLGLKVQMSPEKRQHSESDNCFREISSYEISINNKKIVGSAQYRKGNRFLQHGSILLNIDWDLWYAIWGGSDLPGSMETRITSLSHELNEIPSAIQLTEKLRAEFELSFQRKGQPYNFIQKELEKIDELEKKFRDFY